MAQYTEDWKTQRIVERTLQIMIETCVDIAGHIISDKGYRVPKTYADTFRVLQEEELLDKGLLKTMEKMAKFTNIIVHNYDKVDVGIVVTILKNHLDNFLSYKNTIIHMIKAEE